MGRISIWDNAKMSAVSWADYGERFYDGHVVDNVSTARAPQGSAHRGRAHYNCRAQISLQTHVTDVWTARGITWEDE